MTPRSFLRAILGLCLATALAPIADARQVRVNVAANTFSPQNLTLNMGDHVVWIWTGGSHDVTSGSFTGNGSPDGRFASGATASSRTYSWLSTGATGNQNYYCEAHIALGMTASLNLVNNGSGAAGADFRISEVLYNPVSGADQVEITNYGATGDFSKYRLKINGLAVLQLNVTSTPTVMSVPAGGRVVIHLGVSGTNTATNLFFASASLANAGSLALYVPNTQNTSLTDVTQIIDYVSWNGGSENEATAVSAGLWATSATLPDVAQGHSLEFCGIAGQYGTTFWSEVATPNLGSNGNCSTPLVRSTWGRVKSLYR